MLKTVDLYNKTESYKTVQMHVLVMDHNYEFKELRDYRR